MARKKGDGRVSLTVFINKKVKEELRKEGEKNLRSMNKMLEFILEERYKESEVTK